MPQPQNSLPFKDGSGGRVEIFIDGAARGNPGESGIGIFVTEGGKTLREIKKYLGTATNNQAEYTALITALESVKDLKNRQIQIFTDSMLLANQINGLWKVKHPGIAELHKKAKNLLKEYASISISHVRREYNRDADRLANEAIDEYL